MTQQRHTTARGFDSAKAKQVAARELALRQDELIQSEASFVTKNDTDRAIYLLINSQPLELYQAINTRVKFSLTPEFVGQIVEMTGCDATPVAVANELIINIRNDGKAPLRKIKNLGAAYDPATKSINFNPVAFATYWDNSKEVNTPPINPVILDAAQARKKSAEKVEMTVPSPDQTRRSVTAGAIGKAGGSSERALT